MATIILVDGKGKGFALTLKGAFKKAQEYRDLGYNARVLKKRQDGFWVVKVSRKTISGSTGQRARG